MRTVKISGGKFEIRETPKELPINRFNDFQKYMIQDVGIGSTMADCERHFQQLDTFISHGKIEEAARERYNQHYGLVLAINRINITHLSFAVLIHSVNNRPIKDYSETNLKKVLEKLGDMGLTQAHVEDILEDLKKNSIHS